MNHNKFVTTFLLLSAYCHPLLRIHPTHYPCVISIKQDPMLSCMNCLSHIVLTYRETTELSQSVRMSHVLHSWTISAHEQANRY